MSVNMEILILWRTIVQMYRHTGGYSNIHIYTDGGLVNDYNLNQPIYGVKCITKIPVLMICKLPTYCFYGHAIS